MGDSKTKPALGRELKLSKVQLFGFVGCIVLVIGIVVGIGVLRGRRGGSTIYDDIRAIFSNELGSFNYTFDVRTMEHTGVQESVEEVDLGSIGNADVDSESSVDGGRHADAVDNSWGNKEGTEIGDWEYPNYQINIQGTTMSLDPLETEFTITLATEYYSDAFTDVVVFDGNYYINIEQMRFWLVHSADSYLVSIGQGLPEGSKYLVIPEDKFTYYSRYAEDSEREASGVTGLENIYRRGLVFLQSIISNVSDGLGGVGHTVEGDVKRLDLSGEDAEVLVSVIKRLVTNVGDYYRSMVRGSYSAGLYTDEGYEQALRETDNVIRAVEDVMIYLNMNEAGSVGLTVTGTSKRYKNAYGNDTIEAVISCEYASGGTDHKISGTLIRSGNTKEIVLPTGSQTTVESLSDSGLLGDTLNRVVDYFSFWGIENEKRLELTPEHIGLWAKDSFIDLVNETGTAGYYITRNNLQGYLDKYVKLEVGSDTTREDRINKLLVDDFFEMLNGVTGGLVKEVYVEPDEVVEQYPEIDVEIDGVRMSGKVDSGTISAQLAEVDLVLENTAGEDRTVGLRDFSLRTLLSSVYPSNNEVLLRNYDNTWDLSSLEGEVTLSSGEMRRVKLYFVLSEDTGYMDLWYGEEKLGVAIKY